MKYALLLTMLAPALGWAQQTPNEARMEELRETLRFIRLAETKKKLSFEEGKLLQLNELLDDYEAKRLDLNAQERRLRQRLKLQGAVDDPTAETYLNEYAEIKKAELTNNLQLWEQLKTFLTPSETLAFIQFYDEFQRTVQRRARQLQMRREAPRRRGGMRQQP